MYTQRMTNHRYSLPALVMIIVFTVSGCTSLQFVPLSADSITTEISKGDKVVVKTLDEKMHEFEVIRITDTALYGDQTSILFSDMIKLQVERTETTKTILVVVGIVAAAAAAAAGGGGYGGSDGSGGSGGY